MVMLVRFLNSNLVLVAPTVSGLEVDVQVFKEPGLGGDSLARP